MTGLLDRGLPDLTDEAAGTARTRLSPAEVVTTATGCTFGPAGRPITIDHTRCVFPRGARSVGVGRSVAAKLYRWMPN